MSPDGLAERNRSAGLPFGRGVSGDLAVSGAIRADSDPKWAEESVPDDLWCVYLCPHGFAVVFSQLSSPYVPLAQISFVFAVLLQSGYKRRPDGVESCAEKLLLASV